MQKNSEICIKYERNDKKKKKKKDATIVAPVTERVKYHMSFIFILYDKRIHLALFYLFLKKIFLNLIKT